MAETESPSATHAADPCADPTDAQEPGIDFTTFAMSLASSTLLHLGELAPPPGEPRGELNLPLARQSIDILGMLADKTRGNLTPDEQQLIQHLLYDLRLKYCEARKKQR